MSSDYLTGAVPLCGQSIAKRRLSTGTEKRRGGYIGNMARLGALLLVAVLLSLIGAAASTSSVMSVCQLSKDYPRFRDKLVTVRGVYYYGLRQECPQSCADGVWPSFINVEGGSDAAWAALAKAHRELEAEAKRTGKRFELWVTVVGRLETRARYPRLSPCDRNSWGSGYGHLGVFPAQIVVENFSDIEIRANPKSPYDYAHMYRGPA